LTNLSFSTLGVAEPLLRALATENYTQPTPIQTQAIPLVLSGRDVLGIAQTGTGKTAAFGLPLLQYLAGNVGVYEPKSARALILAPTRELALQIGDSLRAYGRNLKLRHAVILGGVNQNKQVSALRSGVDILVATPGRLLDLVDQKHVRLNTVSVLVIDEADRMFDMGFLRDVRRIVSLVPRKRQSLLFSATMPPDVAKLVAEVLTNPARVDVAPMVVTADRVEQAVHFVETRTSALC
jgi:ATP-dependent RNA helicase RhlE